ncbi:cardiolipin synthase [Anaerosporobacter sp.]|uniref:cardiolipin synthase n=1 Tax=Anaerosporobacter sp. TaxID=1872529 RepID=UPI00286FA3DC|nr:cardiolipin synthase [Anaerosporobacter sp.]
MRGRNRKIRTNCQIEKDITYIPLRYTLAILLAILETITILCIVVSFYHYIPYFYVLVFLTTIGCVVRIIASNDNPDYKIPWLLVVLTVPIVGFMLYFLFYSRLLKKKYAKRLDELQHQSYLNEDESLFHELKKESAMAHNQAMMLCNIANSHLFTETNQTYFSLGEDLHKSLLGDLEKAERFIFMEYFIIEEGIFWNSILDILKRKAEQGLEVRVVYDDIGCMTTLPGNYDKILKKYNIKATPFSKLKGNADSEFNNRSHRKITVIDGIIGYTGGVNIADEYINKIVKFGHWKDVGIRLEGSAVRELTKLFLTDYGINVKKLPDVPEGLFPEIAVNKQKGFLIPFGDGPSPIYHHRVGKCVIQNLLSQASRYVYIMTPYLIIDNELCQTIENAALRGVNVKIIVPHVPDKRVIFEMTRSNYPRLLSAGVEIFEYEPGFIHAKCYLADDDYGMIGTINLDYRSLVHHFENGVWMYQCECLNDIKNDFSQTLQKSIKIEKDSIKTGLIKKSIRSLVKVLSPLL